MRTASSLIPHPSSLRRYRGYSFTEVMFAVVVLGIGFIMVAAMFPVAISQSKSTQEETSAAAIARGAVNVFRHVANSSTSALLPATGTATQPTRPRVFSIRNPQSLNPTGSLSNDDLWNALKGNLITAGDQRYGVALFYRREGDPATASTWSSFVQVIVIVTRVHNRSTYDSVDVTSASVTASTRYNLQGRPIVLDVTSDGSQPLLDQVITVDSGSEGANSVAEGAYIIISDDNISGANEGLLNGRIYRVGAKRDAPDEWELAPGNEFFPLDPDGPGPLSAINGLTDANGFVVGRNRITGGFDGPAQDVAIYTTFVRVPR